MNPGDSLTAGHQIARYQLINQIGQGTTATVWRVANTDGSLTINHAAKVFLGDTATVYGARREAERLNGISNKHVVQLFDVREFIVVDEQSHQYLGRPTTPGELRDAIQPFAVDPGPKHQPWPDPTIQPPGRCDNQPDPHDVLRWYADQIINQSVEIPNPVMTAPGPMVGALLVQTLCTGTLRHHWEANDRRLPEGEAVDIARQVTSALVAVHNHASARPHLDVRMDNILCQDNRRSWLLADLGLVSEPSQMISSDRSPWFLALPDVRGHRASDIWLVGVLLHQLITGLLPLAFAGHPLREIPDAFSARARDLARLAMDETSESGPWIHPDINPGLRRLIEQCLDPDHRRRPSAAELERALSTATGLSMAPIPARAHLTSDGSARIEAHQAAWVLGYDSIDGLEMLSITDRDAMVRVDQLLTTRPAFRPCDPDQPPGEPNRNHPATPVLTRPYESTTNDTATSETTP